MIAGGWGSERLTSLGSAIPGGGNVVCVEDRAESAGLGAATAAERPDERRPQLQRVMWDTPTNSGSPALQVGSSRLSLVQQRKIIAMRAAAL